LKLIPARTAAFNGSLRSEFRIVDLMHPKYASTDSPSAAASLRTQTTNLRAGPRVCAADKSFVAVVSPRRGRDSFCA
jgi:hypothetical protein